MDIRSVTRNLRRICTDDNEVTDMLFDLAIQAREVYRTTGRSQDIDAAVEFTRASIREHSGNSSALPDRLQYLALCLTEKHKRSGTAEDIEEAVKVARQAVKLTPLGHPGRAARLTELGNSLFVRFQRTDALFDLKEAILVARRAVELTASDDPDLASWLNNLGNRLANAYQRTGNMADHEEGLRATRQSVQLTPAGDPNMGTRMNNLANSLFFRSDIANKAADLEEASLTAREALQLLPPDDLIRPILLHNFAIILSKIFDRKQNIADLDEAIVVAREAVALTPRESPSFPIFSAMLSSLLRDYCTQTSNVAILDEATQIAKSAVELTPKDHPDYGARVTSLGLCLSGSYEQTGDMNELGSAIKYLRTAVELAPQDHRERAARLFNLGSCLENRFHSSNKIPDLDEASSYLHMAWDCQNALPLVRMRAASECIRILIKLEKIEDVAKLGQAVIEMLPVVCTEGLNIADRQFVISNFYSIGSDTCSSLLSLRQPLNALQCLEQGRALVISNMIDRWSGLSKLKDEYAELSARYTKLRNDINTPDARFGIQSRPEEGTQRQQKASQLKDCITEIRNIAGFEGFLRGQTVEEMQSCATGGTIVVVNITPIRSDAILVTESNIKAINLPNLIFSEASAWLRKKWTARWHQFEKKNEEFSAYLSWLWNVCVRTIIEQLDMSHTRCGSLPRVWWIGTGYASTMPFHAAGSHAADSIENTLSKVVSSYIPSIKALGFAKARQEARKQLSRLMLMVTMPTTPHQSTQGGISTVEKLPGVLKETDMVSKAVSKHLDIEILNLPNVDQVMQKLDNCIMVHFACHGFADPVELGNSGLILQRFSDGLLEQDRLTLHRISELKLNGAYIAYLSACSTAENKHIGLWDETLHLAAGFQIAGFSHVIGCLLKSSDDICAHMASTFYKTLFQAQASVTSNHGVALALHTSVLSARQLYRSKPLLWAQFIHVGA